MSRVAVVGGGPAGLHAAETLSERGLEVTLYEAKPSVGRKFLVAGRGGLNLTHSEDSEAFASRYRGSSPEGFWTSLLQEWDNQALREWARGLGVETFVGTSGRVFPKEFQSAHLLRRWVRRLRERGVTLATRHRWVGLDPHDGRFSLSFQSQEGSVTAVYDAVILALGGASWPETGSTAAWVPILEGLGLPLTPFAPANCGWETPWSAGVLEQAEGLPLKNIRVSAGALGEHSVAGELLITRHGLEGGALYQLGPSLRSMECPAVTLDLKPTFTAKELAGKVAEGQPGSLADQAATRWRLSPAAAALLAAYAPAEALHSPLLLAEAAKALRIPLTGPRPIAEAISSAGGVRFDALDPFLMVRSLPGLFLAGEMLDWEAPTGGYLLQGCFATGRRAARGVLGYLGSLDPLG